MRDKRPILAYPGKESEGAIIRSTAVAVLERVRTHPAGLEPAATGWEDMLIHGDNLGALKALIAMKKAGRLSNADGTAGARLVYMDPPFSTRQSFRTSSDGKAYDDKLTGAEFVEFLRRRLVLARELLSDNGSVFLHLDWKKAHYMKAVMDELFGEDSFINDIVWSYGGRGAKAIAGQFSRNHDIILWYGGKGRVFNRQYASRRLEKGAAGSRMDKSGRWFKTAPRGDYTDASVEELKRRGRVHLTRNGKVRIKYFFGEQDGLLVETVPVGDVWDDIPDAMHLKASEKTGYPTQKPEALLERVISAASNEGDLVLDPFLGSGTTAVVAQRLGRRWVGIDSGNVALKSSEDRILKSRAKTAPFVIYHAR